MTGTFDPRHVRPENPSVFERLWYGLFDTAIERHDFIARWLDYLPERISIWLCLIVVFSVTAVVRGDPFALILVPFLFLYRVADIKPSTFLINLYEFFVWAALVDVAGSLVVTGEGHAELGKNLVTLFGWVTLTYLFTDLYGPNRPRKKIRLRLRERLRISATSPETV